MGTTPSSLAASGSAAVVASTWVHQPAMSQSLATFAAGCFWGVEKAFRKKFGSGRGLLDARVGYIGGAKENPSYEEVCTGRTNHAEAIQIKFDHEKVSYETLVDFFYRMHDASTLNRQGNDRGTQYRSAIFYHDDEQLRIAKEVTQRAKEFYGINGVATTLENAGTFYDAEGYHQDYLEKNPHGYECPTHFERSWEQIKKQFGGRN